MRDEGDSGRSAEMMIDNTMLVSVDSYTKGWGTRVDFIDES